MSAKVVIHKTNWITAQSRVEMSDSDNFKTRKEELRQICSRQCSNCFECSKDKVETCCWERSTLLREKAMVEIISVVFQTDWYLKSGEVLQAKYFKYCVVNSLFYQWRQMRFDRKFRAWQICLNVSCSCWNF